MIKVRARPVIEPDPDGGWQLVLLAGDPFDHATPFRAMLADIAAALSDAAPTSIDLPAPEDSEDFVEGTLRFGEETLRTYYEHGLGYLALVSASEVTLRRVAAQIDACLIVDRGQ